MKIYSMTATFGKLEHETLILQPGLNIIEAPNEWGKSTWCAFLMSMLYGIDTASRTKTGYLADKEHYAPWSGEPMSGSMDILCSGLLRLFCRGFNRLCSAGCYGDRGRRCGLVHLLSLKRRIFAQKRVLLANR